jgi:hypothetical protein
VLDYTFAVLLMVSPWLLGYSEVMVAKWVAVVAGLLVICYSLFTRYELGIWKMMPMRVHLWFDYVGGALLIIAPWFFGFSEEVVAPFVVFGIVDIIVPLLTHKYAGVPGEDYILGSTGDYVPVYQPRIHH